MTEAQTAVREWIKENPLRMWRKNTGTTLMQTAALVGVSTTAVQQWENGGMRPGDENMAKLAEAMGGTLAKLSETWNTWESRRP